MGRHPPTAGRVLHWIRRALVARRLALCSAHAVRALQPPGSSRRANAGLPPQTAPGLRSFSARIVLNHQALAPHLALTYGRHVGCESHRRRASKRLRAAGTWAGERARVTWHATLRPKRRRGAPLGPLSSHRRRWLPPAIGCGVPTIRAASCAPRRLASTTWPAPWPCPGAPAPSARPRRARLAGSARRGA